MFDEIPPRMARDRQFDAAFQKSTRRALVATALWSMALPQATDFLRVLLWMTAIIAIAFISSWPLITLPSTDKAQKECIIY